MKRTHQPEPPDTPTLNDLNCPRCHKPWRAGHPCEGGDQ